MVVAGAATSIALDCIPIQSSSVSSGSSITDTAIGTAEPALSPGVEVIDAMVAVVIPPVAVAAVKEEL